MIKTINSTRQLNYSTGQTIQKKGTDFTNAKMWISKLIKGNVFQGLKMNAMDLE